MAQSHPDPRAHASEQAPGRPRLRAVGVVCDRCGHEQPLEHARLGAWHVSRDGQHVVCQGCVEVYALELDDVVLYFPVCGHAIEDDEVLYASAVCPICEQR